VRVNADGSFEIPTREVAGTDGIPAVLREHATLGISLKKAALRVVEAWVDETNIDKPYGVDGDTSLITAASQGDDAEVELYLDAGCDLTICNQRGYSAIASAACQGMDDCLMMLIAAANEQNILLDNGVTLLEKPNDRGETPLILASLHGWTDCVKILLDHGANPHTTSLAGFSAFISAAEFGNIDVVQLLHQRHTDVVWAQTTGGGGGGGWTAVHLAARNGYLRIVQTLWTMGGQKLLDIRRNDGRTPLMSAVVNGDHQARRDIVDFFIDKNVDMLSGLDHGGSTCLHIASASGQVKMLEFLITRMHQTLGEPRTLEWLFKKKTDESQMTLLHLAIVRGHSDVFFKLVDPETFKLFEDGVGVCKELLRATCFHDRSCLHLAAVLGKKKLVSRLLLEWERHQLLHLVQAQQMDGRTALHTAANFGRCNVVEQIYRSKYGGTEQLLKADKDGWTALHWACDQEHQTSDLLSTRPHASGKHSKKNGSVLQVCQFLLGEPSGTDSLFQREQQGSTALHLAARSASKDLLHLILKQAGAKVGHLIYIPRNDGLLAAHGAARKGRVQVLRVLHQYGGVGAFMSSSEGTVSCVLEALYQVFDGHKEDQIARREAAKLACDFLLSLADPTTGPEGHPASTMATTSELSITTSITTSPDAEVHAYAKGMLEDRLSGVASRGMVGCRLVHMAAAASFDDMLSHIYRLADHYAPVEGVGSYGKGGGRSALLSCDADGWCALHWVIAASKRSPTSQQQVDDFDSLAPARMRTLRFVLANRGVISQRDKSGIHPLHLACATNNVEVLRLLISHVTVSPASSNEEESCLESFQDEIVCAQALALLEQPITATPPAHITWATAGMTSILMAARAGALKVLKVLCDSYDLSDLVVDGDKRSALHHSCLGGHLPVVKYLLARARKRKEKVAERIGEVDIRGRTCLHAACCLHAVTGTYTMAHTLTLVCMQPVAVSHILMRQIKKCVCVSLVCMQPAAVSHILMRQVNKCVCVCHLFACGLLPSFRLFF